MKVFFWIGLVFSTACATEYGQSLRCTTDADCAQGRVCEPIQRYCVLPVAGEGPDSAADSSPVDASVVADGMVLVDSAPPAPDAETPPADSAMPTTDASIRQDAGPVDMSAPVGPAECGNGRVEEGEECDIPQRGNNQHDFCDRDCLYTADPFVYEERELVLPVVTRNRGNARRNCTEWGGALVILADIAKLSWMVTEIADRLSEDGNSDVWVGLVKRNDVWRWEDGSPTDALIWCDGGPRNNHECAVLDWSADEVCFTSKGSCDMNGSQVHYICERAL